MDKKSFAQFLIFCAAVLIAWWLVSYLWLRPGRNAAPQPAPVEVQPGEAQPAANVEPSFIGPQAPSGEAPAAPEGQAEQPEAQPPAEPQPEPATADLENGMLRTRWTNRGAALARLELLDERYKAPYKEGGERPVLTLLRDFQEGLYSDVLESVTFYASGPDGKERTLESATADRMYELTRAAADGVAFATVLRDAHGHALEVRKSVTAEPGAHHYSVELEFANTAEQPCKFAFALRGPAGIEREVLSDPSLGTRVGISEDPGDYEVKKATPRDLEKGPQVNESADICWAAVANHYFAAVLDPEDDSWVGNVVSRSVVDTNIREARGRWAVGSIRKESDRPRLSRQNATVVVQSTAQKLEPGEKLTIRYILVAAPKEPGLLASYDGGLEKLIEYGMLPGVSRVVVIVLNGIHYVLPNYGLALIILTIIVRALLHPLTRKSQIGMTRMQKLQPMVEELQRKYADDKQKLTQEQMALWRKYGVSPMGGCLPLLLQMPVFFALFGALRAAIELRHAGFLWVSDLSGPDTLFHLPFFLPILQNEFNLLPILMAGVMFFTQPSTMTAATDQARQQQKMMKYMPLIFAVFFYSLPSGLCLYILTSTLAGAFERWLVGRQTDKMELRPVDETARDAKRGRTAAAKPRSGWMGKLQKMIEDQTKAGGQPRGKAKGK